jgi:hypothetical protein
VVSKPQPLEEVLDELLGATRENVLFGLVPGTVA